MASSRGPHQHSADPLQGASRFQQVHTPVEVWAPGYISRSVFLDFNPATVDVVLLAYALKTVKGPGVETAALKNFEAASRATYFAGTRLRDFIGTSLALKQDRGYFSLPDGAGLDKILDRTGAFRSVSGKMHEPHEEGFEFVGSWKTTRGVPDLQVTLWRRERMFMINTEGYAKPMKSLWEYVAELDVDLRTGRRHGVEVFKNMVSGGKTHPYLVCQAIAWSWGVVPFRLEASSE